MISNLPKADVVPRNGSHITETIPCVGQDGKVNILLVDDRPDKLLALEAVLSDLGQNLYKARSGKEALRFLLEQNFAVILLDVTMPGMDGFETAALIRKRRQSQHTPIIFITSMNGSEEHITQGYSLGAVDYILSPIVPQILRSKVSVFVELHRRTEQVRLQSDRLRLIEEDEHRRQLAEAADRLETETKRNRFFTLSLDLLAIANFDGRFLQLNPAWEKTLGYRAEELKSKPILEFVHPDDRVATEREFLRLKEGSASVYFENRFASYDRSFRWLGWTAAPFASEKLLYLFARDMTGWKLAEQKIQNLNHQLEDRVQELTDLNNELENLCYSIAHDLRAPLRAMEGMTKALVEDYASSLDQTAQGYAKRIIDASTRMDALIQDLLAYGRLNHLEINPRPADVLEQVNRVLVFLEEEIQARDAGIQIIEPMYTVRAQPEILRQVLSNLMLNAVKFVAPGVKPQVIVRAERKGAFVCVRIQDNGIGIPREYQERIFGMFQRLHHDRFPGTGIGLAIVRRGVERMGGKVGVESEEGKGSSFWFLLPQAGADERVEETEV